MTSKLSHSGSYLVELLYVDESEVGVVAGHQEVVDVSRVGSLRKYAVAGPGAWGIGYFEQPGRRSLPLQLAPATSLRGIFTSHGLLQPNLPEAHNEWFVS